MYKKKYHFNPYLGIGINYIHIVEIDLITDKEQSKGSKLGTNFKTGLLYDLNSKEFNLKEEEGISSRIKKI